MGLYSLALFLLSRFPAFPQTSLSLAPYQRHSSRFLRTCLSFSRLPISLALSPHAADSSPVLGCFVFLPRPTGSIKTTKCCLSIRWYAHSWSTTLLWHSPGGTGLPTLSQLSFSLSLSLCSSTRVLFPPSFSFQLHRRRLFFRPFIGGSPYSWAFASLPDNPRVKLLCPVGIALARTTFPPFARVRGHWSCATSHLQVFVSRI